jgi:hypothetical protein
MLEGARWIIPWAGLPPLITDVVSQMQSLRHMKVSETGEKNILNQNAIQVILLS